MPPANKIFEPAVPAERPQRATQSLRASVVHEREGRSNEKIVSTCCWKMLGGVDVYPPAHRRVDPKPAHAPELIGRGREVLASAQWAQKRARSATIEMKPRMNGEPSWRREG